MSPRDYFATCVPKKGMVEFRDVFGSSAGKPATSSSLEELEPTRTNRDTSLAESFNTFGPRHRQPSTESTQEDDDEWSYTLSAYGSDNDEDPLGHRRRRQSSSRPQRIPDIAEPFPSIPPHLRFIPPETDSPLSLPSSELVTPNSHITELPRRSIQSVRSDTPTPRAPHPFTSSGEGGGLQLDFAPKASDSFGSSKPTPFPLRRPRTATIDKVLPLIPANHPNPFLSQTADTSVPHHPSGRRESDQTQASIVEQAHHSVDRSTVIQLQVDQVIT